MESNEEVKRQKRRTCDYVVSYAISVGSNNYMRTSQVRLVQKEDESEMKFVDTVCESHAEICMRLRTAIEQVAVETGMNDFTVCILNYWRDSKSCWGYTENP